MRGKFIVIEGIDGSGKTTQVKMLKERMEERGIHLHTTRECSDGPIGKLLRNTYLAGKRKCDEHVINYLYAADRLDHITNEEDGMLKFINAGLSVLSDRYVMSSLAYDTYMHIGTDTYGDALLDILNRNRRNIELLSPDITVVINVPPEIACKRLYSNRDELSVYESIDKIDKIHKSYSNAITLLEKEFGHHIAIVDGTKSPSEISNDIYSLVASMF